MRATGLPQHAHTFCTCTVIAQSRSERCWRIAALAHLPDCAQADHALLPSCPAALQQCLLPVSARAVPLSGSRPSGVQEAGAVESDNGGVRKAGRVGGVVVTEPPGPLRDGGPRNEQGRDLQRGSPGVRDGALRTHHKRGRRCVLPQPWPARCSHTQGVPLLHGCLSQAPLGVSVYRCPPWPALSRYLDTHACQACTCACCA